MQSLYKVAVQNFAAECETFSTNVLKNPIPRYINQDKYSVHINDVTKHETSRKVIVNYNEI